MSECFITNINFFKDTDLKNTVNEFQISDYAQKCDNLMFSYLQKKFSSSIEFYPIDGFSEPFKISIKIGDDTFTINGSRIGARQDLTSLKYLPYYETLNGDNVSFGIKDRAYKSRNPSEVLVKIIYKSKDIVYTFTNISREYGVYYIGSWEFKLTISIEPFKIYNEEEIYGLIKNINEPKIFIASQLLIDLSDIGNTFFTVSNIKDNFEKSCPKIVTVLKGKGLNMWDKLNDLYANNYPCILGLDFVSNIVKYSMLKYLLGKLLYNKFNIKYLLNRYHEKLIEDLKKSEYNDYLSFFITGELKNYNQYFKD